MGLWDLYGNKIKTPDYKVSFSLFNSFAVIGDSFAATMANSNVSWPLIIEKMSGVKSYNFSYGGLSTKTWLTNATYGLAKMLDSPPAELYIIALGINDAWQSITVGSTSDIDSDSTDSFYSYYGRIIRAIKSHAPNALIMLATPARFGSTYDSYSTAVINIGQHYDIPVFDLSKDKFFKSELFSEYQISDHPMAVARSAMAEEYMWLVEQELENNIADYLEYRGQVN